jgi:hypothetical protein
MSGESMSDDFNPYREWLGLKSAAPNYYELLGVALQETDKATIAAAAERAIARVRSVRPGPRAREWSRLLDELRGAKECLTDAEKRARYDEGGAENAEADSLLPPGCDVELEALAPAAPLPVVIEPVVEHEDVWAAGPSPIYGVTAGEVPKPIPVGSVLPVGALPEAFPVAAQPSLRTASASRKAKQAAGRGGFGWGTAAVVLGLVLVAAGLTYRLSVISRERKQAENQQFESEPMPVVKPRAAKPLVTEPPAKRTVQSVSPVVEVRPVAPNDTAMPRAVPANEPVVEKTVERPEPVVVTVVPGMEQVSKVSRTQVQALVKSLEGAKGAIVIQDFKTADTHLARATMQAVLPKHREAVARLKTVRQHVEQFRQALVEAVGEMGAAESFTVGPTPVSFVEGKKDAVILRVKGKNETYRFNDMPPGLAVAIADRKLQADVSEGLVVKGAYLLLNKRADGQTRAKAEELWREALASGGKIEGLMPFLQDEYAGMVRDAMD